MGDCRQELHPNPTFGAQSEGFCGRGKGNTQVENCLPKD